MMGPRNATDNTYLGKHVVTTPVVLSRESGNIRTVGFAAPNRHRTQLGPKGPTSASVVTNAPAQRQLEYYGHPATQMLPYLRRM